MKRIDISTKKYPNVFALVDDEDFEWLNQWKWYARQSRTMIYVHRYSYKDGKSRSICMHRLITRASDDFQVDHINHNGLDNRRINLRKCTPSQNQGNSRLRVSNTSGYKGVVWHKRDNRWRAVIKINGDRKYLGEFFCIVKAAKAYDAAARKYHGEFANTNFKEKK